MKKMIMLVLALSLATVLAACGDDSASDKNADKNNDKKSEETAQPAKKEVEITDKEKVDNDKVVTKINGQEIKGKKYNASYAQTKMLMSQYGQDVSDLKNVKKQALNVIVQQELLKQDAKEKGIEVSEKEVQKEFETIKKNKADQLAAVLEKLHLTEASYKKQLAFEITLSKYMKQEIKATEVSDKEVQAYYDKLKEQSKDIPKLDEMKKQIKGQLEQQKQQKQLQAKIEKLKKNAEIKHMI
ncbi:SurA N-terminal domain-containing protein [Virgibacillus necropolis]|uniref:SurA N-terminal domain-containing protein n=1 Tax=Virgibacillus necropolis TaxID=163877 RepID=UPI00384D5774